MTLVKFLDPLKSRTHKDRVLAVLFFAHHHKGLASLTVDNIRLGLQEGRAKGWKRVKVASILTQNGDFVKSPGTEGKRRLWKLSASGEQYIRDLMRQVEVQGGSKITRKWNLQRKIAKLLLSGIAAVLVITVTITVLLRWLDPPTTSFIIQNALSASPVKRDCKRIRHPWVNWKEISPHVAVAILAAEDQRFPDHSGFDLDSIEDALRDRLLKGRVRGASTISQQLAKNLFLWPGRSLVRKGLEAYFTTLIEATWPKRRILEVYLNVAQFGPCTFGIASASKRYFQKPADAINRKEASLLAAVLPNPRRFRVENPSNYVMKRSAWVQRQARFLGGPNYLREL
jgi:monofunctional biosynthetic peptidoglycan transglycosylase